MIAGLTFNKMWPPAAIDWTTSHSCTHSFFLQKWGDGQLCEGHCSDGVDIGQMLPLCVPRERTDIWSCVCVVGGGGVRAIQPPERLEWGPRSHLGLPKWR